jgi:hypothetical protein
MRVMAREFAIRVMHVKAHYTMHAPTNILIDSLDALNCTCIQPLGILHIHDIQYTSQAKCNILREKIHPSWSF